MASIAITGMACRYPEARSPRELWENVLAQRQSFRRVPSVRLRVEDYSPEAQADDQIYVKMAAVLEDYEFDRIRFQVSKETFASTDLAHWLALDVAYKALEDAKLLDASEVQRERIGVYVGNSLTGEFSRAHLLRLRWPYVRRVLAQALEKKAQNGDLHALLAEIEELYKAPFPATTEESLAGGLSNTIAGRICNYFNLKGGGYTVDGACASSLLAVTTACSALESGDVDVAIAGGVDLSLDPFELAGFSKLGALAAEKMRVFDAHSAGFWPGEGCGMVVLMRHEDAAANHHSPYAVIRGWGISSDGSGGITRPEVSGQMLALRRAYQRAGYGIDEVSCFEGHGTGTSVGDATELQALSTARREACCSASPAALGSIKANIGHTKAAAGVAGLIKATMAAQAKMLPPTTGCDTPHSELTAEKPMLRVLRTGELWPEGAHVRAGVSAMGFGGINTHVTLEAADPVRRRSFTGFERQQLASYQDCEMFLFQAADREALSVRLREILGLINELSLGEMRDLAALLAKQITDSSEHGWRAACVAATPDELETKTRKLLKWCEAGIERIDISEGVFLGTNLREPRIAFLFTGQGSPVYAQGGIWSRRFVGIRELYRQAGLPATASIATEIAQPCVVTASLAGLHALELCGIEANVALGHSLGEMTALYWAGALDKYDLLRMVSARGRIMAQTASPSGAMASIGTSREEVKRRINGDPLSIAACNSSRQTVISGDATAVRQFTARLASEAISTTILPVSHAFHSPLVAGAADSFHDYLQAESFAQLKRPVISTVTGSVLEEEADLRELLTEQITMPVEFARALEQAATNVDILIEVGPGAVLSGIAAESLGDEKPIIPLNVGSESLRGLMLAFGAAFASGANLRPSALFADRFVRPFDLKRRHAFLQNPCESIVDSLPQVRSKPALVTAAPPIVTGSNSMEVLRNLIAQRTELPLANIRPENRFLDDLHLNSITVSQIILQAATQLNLSVPQAPTEYANVTIAEAAKTLDAIGRQAPARSERFPGGVDSWIRVLAVELVEKPLRSVSSSGRGEWRVLSKQSGSLTASLQREFQNVPGNGIVCVVPPDRDEETAAFLFQCAQATAREDAQQIVFVGEGVAALARTLYLERPRLKVTVVNVPPEHPQAADWVTREARCASGFTEVHYDAAGIRREPRLKLLWPDKNSSDIGLESHDVLLVTGGGKGIAAECALALARESKCTLALIGRSNPEQDRQLEENLRRFKDSGVSFRYFAADVADQNAVARAIRKIEIELGCVTAVLHGAGMNSPKRLEEITANDVKEMLGAKVGGLRNILSRVDASKLRLLVSFGSIIARTGLHGEAHYGLANEWLASAVERWQREHPACRCVNLEWSVWAGAGMGQRLGVLDSLVRQGITPLPLEEAISALKNMLAWKEAPVSAIVTSRFGNLPTLQFPDAELPLRRFLEHIEVYYPGIELIADAELSTDTDPYLAEHVFQGEQLLPAVCGIEAMAQAAMALENTSELPEFRELRFEHPIVIPPRKPVRIRIAALRRAPGRVSVAVRCASTSFQVDHFSSECVFDSSGQLKEISGVLPKANGTLPLNPERDLYGRILFHKGRFQRVEKYRYLQADESVAELGPPASAPWYARHLPAEFVAGNPASRDAALHSIQACIPHKTILPVGIERIVAIESWTRERATISAIERLRDGDDFIYDLEIQNADGGACEFWQGLHLRAVAPIKVERPWPLPLLAPYLERKLNELLSSPTLKLRIVRACKGAPEIEETLRQMFGGDVRLSHRPDGKPELAGFSGNEISLSHAGPLTLVFAGNSSLGCDLEPIVPRDAATWKQMLGQEGFALARFVAQKCNLHLDSAATCVWTLNESLRKAGANSSQPLRFESATSDDWFVCSAGAFAAAACHVSMEGFDNAFAFGFVVRKAQ